MRQLTENMSFHEEDTINNYVVQCSKWDGYHYSFSKLSFLIKNFEIKKFISPNLNPSTYNAFLFSSKIALSMKKLQTFLDHQRYMKFSKKFTYKIIADPNHPVKTFPI